MKKLESYLHILSDNMAKLSAQIDTIGAADVYLPIKKIDRFITRFDSMQMLYLKANNVLHVPDQKLQLMLRKRQSMLLSHPYFEKVNHLYVSVKNETDIKFEALQQLRVHMSLAIQTHHEEMVRFNSNLMELRHAYIPFSRAKKMAANYTGTVAFYSKVAVNEVTDNLYASFISIMDDLENKRVEWNREFLARELKTQQDFLSDIDGRSLDEQQRLAVLTQEDNNLVLAGAGSGKTLTIAGKVKYLVEQKGVAPEDILLLSFTKKTVAEMKERINDKMGLHVDVRTFHSLGMTIIRDGAGKTPDVLDPEKNHLVDDYLTKHVLRDPKLMQSIVFFFGMYFNVPEEEEEEAQLGDRIEKTKPQDLLTLKGKIQQLQKQKTTIIGEKTKSIEETMIANFLFLHGIQYEYERDYEHDTRGNGYRQYKPDFYLPEYGIYLEHFGITEDDKTPWLSEIEELKYIDGISWKRKVHKDHKTTLVETYSYYQEQGILFSQLEQKLNAHGVVFKNVDTSIIFKAISSQESSSHYSEFKKLCATFINLFKSNGYGKEMFSKLIAASEAKYAKNIFHFQRTRLFFSIAEQIYMYYENKLQEHNQIDFNDMINKATFRTLELGVNFDYRYIIVDEYQDISQSRFKLVKAIKNKSNAILLCVGDDWQSIYKFAGSDLDLFTSFSSYVGKTELLRIEKTYRNSQELIDVAGTFVMKNKRQFQKRLRSDKSADRPIKLIKYHDKITALKELIVSIASRYSHEQEIMLLGRNNRDIEVLLEEQSEFRYDNNTGKVVFLPDRSIKLFYLTVHKSKGMEADQVILINAENKTSGFPNKIADDPLLQWVLTRAEEMSFAEERRLFYVALTRTKNNTYILAPQSRKQTSLFVKELEDEFREHIEIDGTNASENVSNHPNCPKCGTGKLIQRSNPKTNKAFVSCTNFPGCDQSYNDVVILDNPIKCVCGGFLVKRVSSRKQSPFLGCTNFPHCKETRGASYRTAESSGRS
ncbi:UvrD-helicase domain-containing protein [Paenibacillus humicus]|uniref:UvrD-helicase domain-containing protein n=1 Tax=Paenibacillus humicus TaxID=412861 RepID=UPI003F173877